MRHSDSNKTEFPYWLLCLLLFCLLLVLSFALLPRLYRQSSRQMDVMASVSAGQEKSSPEEAVAEASPAAEEELESAADSAENAEPAVIVPETESEAAAPAEVSPAENPAPSEAQPAEPAEASAENHIHSYRNGVCTVCGEKPVFCTGFLPDEFYQETEHAGTVQLHSYTATFYANHGFGEVPKSFNIYLPYGYDETKPYDVLVLIPGGGGNQDSWLNEVYDYGDIQMCGKVLFDRMFETGVCKPCIIVSPCVETRLIQGLTAGIIQMQDELRETILPYVAENYSTYAEDGSLESLRKARDHFALGGLSNGALFVYEGGMRHNFDLFGSYAAFSGNGEPWVTVAAIQDGDYASLPIRCYFTGAGTQNDLQQYYTQIGYDYFVENEPRLTEGTNAWHVDVEGEHEWKVWFTDIYNALPLLFQETD